MKVVEKTHSKLVMENRPASAMTGIAMAVIFAICAAIGVALDPTIALAVFALGCSLIVLVPYFVSRAAHTRLTLDAETNNIYFERKSLAGWTGVYHPLSELHCAEIEKQTDRAGTLYRPVIGFKAHSKKDQIVLVQSYSAARYAQEAVDVVNKWLDLSRQNRCQAG